VTEASDRFIRMNDVEGLIGLKNSAIYRLIQRGEFPTPIKLGSASRWSLRTVEAWMNERGNAGRGQ